MIDAKASLTFMDALLKGHTDPDFIKEMKKLASLNLSAEELQEQRVSFIMGQLPSRIKVTRETIEKKIVEHDGTKAA
jgi:hypothetical protein